MIQQNSQPVDNTFATVTFDANHNVQDFKSYYVPQSMFCYLRFISRAPIYCPTSIARVEDDLPNLSQQQAVQAVTTTFPNFTWQSEEENYAYFIRPDGHTVFTIILHFNSGDATYRANVNTLDGTVEALTNTATGASIAMH